jgi:hypothetical protein
MANLERQNQLYFSLSELCITPKEIPQKVADKLLKYHVWPMNELRKELDSPVWASQSSGYRPEWYEKQRGRSGNSQHCFVGKGAVDWTAYRISDLLKLLLDKSSYTRICLYENNRFIHCDYKRDDGRWFYTCESPTSQWKLIHKI